MKRFLFICLAMVAFGVQGQGAKEIHGSGDLFATSGVTIAWGIQRGANADAAEVVVRVAVDTKIYPWLAAIGVDPFTKEEKVRQQPTMVPGAIDVRIPRSQVGDHPHTQFRLYASEAAARAGTPALVVFYHGVPDTTPEFTGAAALDAHLHRRIIEGKK